MEGSGGVEGIGGVRGGSDVGGGSGSAGGSDGAMTVAHPHDDEDEDEENEDGLSLEGLVDLRKAQPSLLQPRALAQAVSIALRAAQEDRVVLIAEGTSTIMLLLLILALLLLLPLLALL